MLQAVRRSPPPTTVLHCCTTGILGMGSLALANRASARHHFLDELRKARLRIPAELLPRLAGVADQEIDFGRAEIYGIDANQSLAGFLVDAGLLDALAAPRCCGRLQQMPLRRIRAPSGFRRSPARNRRARPPARSR